jgi:hypothetical protein
MQPATVWRNNGEKRKKNINESNGVAAAVIADQPAWANGNSVA